MGIFIKRPLCLFCFCFIFASLLACSFSGRYALVGFFFCLGASVLLFAFSFIFKNRKYGLIEAFIALLFAAVAFLVFHLSINMPILAAENYCGEDKTVHFLVLDEDYSSRYSSRYTGKIIMVNGEETNITASFICEYEGDYTAGDYVLGFGKIIQPQREEGFVSLPEEILLNFQPTVENEQMPVYKYDGFRLDILCARMRNYISGIFFKRLDFESASLSIGLLTGNKSFVATETVRDFRRAGLSHVLAVSGLHLSIIIGFADFALKKLRVNRSLRCILMTALSLILLALAGFSASACRSVLMLLCAYLCFMLSRDSDALTSLGIAGFVLLLLSPYSVGDIGFWLSFLATLGLVSWLSLLTDLIARLKSKKSLLSRLLLSAFGKLCVALSTTFCASATILFVSWLVFGEVSVIGLLSNIVVTPLCSLYLIVTLSVLALGAIPYLSLGLAALIKALCNIITELTSFFSSFSFAVVSLRYLFAGIIICVMTVMLAVLLVVKLKHKRIILAVPFGAIAAFCICLCVHNTVNTGYAGGYISASNRDSLVLTNGNSAVIVDASDGTYDPFYNARILAEASYATEIDAIVLTHYHARHISSLDRLCRQELVRTIYLPIPSTEDDMILASNIARSAKENGVSIITYQYGDSFEAGSLSFSVDEPLKCPYSTRKILFFSVKGDEETLVYADSSWEHTKECLKIASQIAQSDVTILGVHGPERAEERDYYVPERFPERLIVGSLEKVVSISYFELK